MAKNITVQLDDVTHEMAEYEAVHQNRSLPQWVAELISEAISKKSDFEAAKKRSIERLKQGLNLAEGKPLSRDEIYAERTRLR